MSNIVTQRFVVCHQKLKKEGRIRSSRQFALALDYLPQSLSEILKGRRDATVELLRKAVEVYQMNPVYLFTGEGSLFVREEEQKSLRVLTVVTDAQKEEQIVHVPMPAQTGYASESGSPSFIQELPSYTLPDYKYKVGTHRSFDLVGDSMEPTLFEGDKVVCSFLEPSLWESSLKDNYVYVVVTRGDILIKRMHNILREEKEVELLSDNPYYEKTRVKRNEIREIWYVRAKISPFLPSPKSIKNQLQDEISELRSALLSQTQKMQKLYDTVEEVLLAKKEKK